MDVDVVRLLERRHEDARSGRALLMHVVRDRRLVGVLHLLDHQPRFFLREHEPVAVVVVARVLVIQVRDTRGSDSCPSSCTSDRAPAPGRRDSATAPAARPSCRGSPSRRGSIRSPACARSAGSTGRCPPPSSGSSRRADRTDALPPPASPRLPRPAPRGSASFRLISTSRGSRFRFSGELIVTSTYGCPIVVVPICSYLTRSVCLASNWKYSRTFGYLTSSPSAPISWPTNAAGVGTLEVEAFDAACCASAGWPARSVSPNRTSPIRAADPCGIFSRGSPLADYTTGSGESLRGIGRGKPLSAKNWRRRRACRWRR